MLFAALCSAEGGIAQIYASLASLEAIPNNHLHTIGRTPVKKANINHIALISALCIGFLSPQLLSAAELKKDSQQGATRCCPLRKCSKKALAIGGGICVLLVGGIWYYRRNSVDFSATLSEIAKKMKKEPAEKSKQTTSPVHPDARVAPQPIAVPDSYRASAYPSAASTDIPKPRPMHPDEEAALQQPPANPSPTTSAASPITGQGQLFD